MNIFHNLFPYPATGPVPSPFDCFLVNRGLKTLHVRMKEHMKNGLAVAHFLEANPRVERVLHPGSFQSHFNTRRCANMLNMSCHLVFGF